MRIPGSALIVFLAIGAAPTFAEATAGKPPALQQISPAPQQPAAPSTQTPPPGTPAVPGAPATPGAPVPGTPGAPLPVDRIFASDAGLIINPIRLDKVADFEMVMGKVHEALARSTDPVRQKQA